jgi:EmrB/QacA subfamily drug resistance transporter
VDAPRQHHNVTLGILVLAGTAFALQQTMVFPALPTFQEEFDTSTAWATWVLTGFLVSAAVTTPILGRLGDQYGKGRMLMVSLGFFLVGCIGASFAWSIWSLIAFRIVSGAGGALFPLSFAIIRDEFPPERVKMGIGIVSAVFGIGGGFGIVLSGVIVDNYSWRWLFVAGSLPVAVAIVLIHRFVPESPVRSGGGTDVAGALLLSGALVSLMVGLTEGERWGWTSPAIVGLLLASALLFVVWGLVELRARSPMVDMRMLANPPVLLTNVTALITGFALFSCFALIPIFVQADDGYGFAATATEAGLYLLPSSIVTLFAGPAAGLLGRRYGSKWPLAGGMVLVSIAALILAEARDEPWHVLLASGLLGLGVGLAFAAMAALIAESVKPTETGVATGMNTVIRMVGAVLGGQIGAALLTAYTLGDTSIPSEYGFTVSFALAAVAGLAAAAVATAISPRGAPRPLAADSG